MVLIVEDENISRHALERLLELHGHEARGAASAEEAMGLVSRGDRPNVALVDINLPGMSGVECIQSLKALLPDAQIVMLTVYEDTDLIFGALSLLVAVPAGAFGARLFSDYFATLFNFQITSYEVPTSVLLMQIAAGLRKGAALARELA